MVEYVVVLAFGVMVLIGPAGDVMQALLDVMKGNYTGYTYAMSLSEIPDYDNLYEFGMSTDEATSARAQVDSLFSQIEGFTDFPTLDSFDDLVADQMPNSASDIVDGALSIF